MVFCSQKVFHIWHCSRNLCNLLSTQKISMNIDIMHEIVAQSTKLTDQFLFVDKLQISQGFGCQINCLIQSIYSSIRHIYNLDDFSLQPLESELNLWSKSNKMCGRIFPIDWFDYNMMSMKLIYLFNYYIFDDS